ncbi:MAG: hypothetical protein UW88_C0010G0033 [Candidatus Collierbacteria bacterium GW2011_GWD2_45_10]|uniref:Uncharacterized protein n=1 Tax=Candidatus Collierbacteria bacterium GW2011_GWB2_44_22 TaxID=1618387 RepID=A0A0G1K4M8_9BACT|nr:MAG: hypothetical protein UW44_C0014G0014 [Candidatus Collierbacteria bacterium GW2011_GWB2_44_22]KKT65667.1 MAG: hypothetical protein UW58_C0023G0010 [Candidatus Collierbacteria bacterium GW2011_GWC2_44_30]KKT88557.1 MAG: hypothetical protein UW88_C0010G0033 [Candidatus Collierbacteria bacterium GW2011_GWD2_45_10]
MIRPYIRKDALWEGGDERAGGLGGQITENDESGGNKEEDA